MSKVLLKISSFRFTSEPNADKTQLMLISNATSRQCESVLNELQRFRRNLTKSVVTAEEQRAKRNKFLSHVRTHRSFILKEFQHVDDDSAECIETLGKGQSEGPFASLIRRWKTKDVKNLR